MNLKRGVCKALKYGGVGFLIPVSIVGAIAAFHFGVHDIPPVDRENDIARLPMLMLLPSLGLAALFALSAFATFTFSGGLTFMRSLTIISSVALVAVFVSRPRLHFKTVNPNVWLEVVVPVVAVAVATTVIMTYNRMAGATSHTNRRAEPETDAVA